MVVGVRRVIFCTAFTWLVGCSATGTHREDGVRTVDIATTEITLSDKGRDVAIKSGQRVTIKLEETPGTGYRWGLAADVPRILRLIGSRYIAPTGAQLGKPGISEWTFEALGSGDGQLYLKRSRSWESNSTGSADFEITVHVTR
ncbi:protease inhibitor I42 family protein [Paraburkholderia bengalensis]|uniref:Protease inhibitor I42 family protein n=1 Tax=Paraburkholderia bengalensis TaxID=2747562 RepID=A0ABU8IKJ7_9BURK